MRNKYKKILKLSIAISFATTSLYGQAVVNINKSVQYQKIEGFGTQFGKTVSWSSSPMSDEDHLKRIIDDLGISMHRVWIEPKLEMVNDNDDPNNTDLAKFKANLSISSNDNCKGEWVTQQTMIDYMKLYKARALKNGDTISATSGSVKGNPVFFVGSATGKDGIGGASFASANITAESTEELPAVQVGDPFQEKKLLEACLEVIQTGADRKSVV